MTRIKELGANGNHSPKPVSRVILLATGESLSFKFRENVLEISLPEGRIPEDHTLALKIS